MSARPWGYWHRPQGGWWVWDEQGDATVIGYVAATDEGWVAFPTWTGGLARIVGPFHNRNAAAMALFAAWKADPDTNAPEVPTP